ncbi:adaptor protein MecA [Lentilactobacillus farraginis]|uniref:Adapter protein MecA n=1 Tax=Lentilactobacillus farraginis DSM 18382 = JCM 14108 TaxID=1423743 RepID=X0PH95_9LACO|nr:adaptor protein MecA [Lentilactobacillus farraginis]KRM00984.1 competence negative regulator MecA [Lentilactobacillus farraginis DSM 18382 = JCM 14108]GAF35811.1 negative regulator of genetic competence MecA [Lentilactobacillus farraginis DSM 18382 = JCM 14108]
MEMERINENTIRVLIGNDDLDKRGITVLDLLGNHKQIESFFYSILEEVDKDHQFQNNDAVTFQVLPNQNGLELFISKDVDMSDEDEPLLGSGDGRGKHDQVSKYIDEHRVDDKPQNDKKTNDEFGHQKRTVILEFDDLNDFIELSKALRLENGTSDLFLYEGRYFLKLQLFSNDPVNMIVSDEVAIANEYGKKTTVTEDVLNEYGQQIMENSALELSRYYFK